MNSVEGPNEGREVQPKPYTIRPAAEEDTPKMGLLLERANEFRAGNPLPEKILDQEKYDELQQRLKLPGAWSRLAFDGDELAGFVVGHPSSTEETIESNPDTEYLALLMMEPGYWGKGVAGQLIDEATKLVKDEGKKDMLLWVATDNLRARQLYERKGYNLTDATRISKRQGPLVQYRLDLA